MTSCSKRSRSKLRLLSAAFFLLGLCAPLSGALALGPAAGEQQFETPKLEIPLPNVSFSQGISNDSAITLPWIAQYVSGVYTFLISIVGMVAAVMMIIGGFQYLTSAGDNSKIMAGKKRIVDALIGLTLTFGSYLMLYTINPNLVSFASLRLVNVKGTPIAAFDDSPSADDETMGRETADSESAPVSESAVGPNLQVCGSAAACLPYCQKAGCTKVFCRRSEASSGYSSDCVTNTHQSDCDQSKFPDISGPGIIAAGSPELIPKSKWPQMTYIKADSGVKAAQAVIDGLVRADRYIGDNYADQKLTIRINTCWRDYREDFSHQCTTIMRPTENDPTDWLSTWPGGNPHSSGSACDLELERNGVPISAGHGEAHCKSKEDGDKLLIEILTNPVVGARRLNYEPWHFNWANWNSCFCAMGECDAHTFPISTGKKKCYAQVKPNPNC